MKSSRFTRYAAATLAVTLFVIVWGAYVRASGAGAGCGSHWPTCNGEVIPRAPSTATLIEATHRATSGIALLLVVGQLFFARRTFASGHLVRRAAGWSLLLMITEALIGAGLVLFKKVAQDTSISRGYWMSAHLINTFLLLAAMGVVLWASLHPEATLGGARAARRRAAWLLGSSLVAVLVTGVTGAIAALGDTLFPAQTFASGLAMDTSPQAHLFVQLRALHPFVAAGAAVHLFVVASAFGRSSDEGARRAAKLVGLLVLAQVCVGLINLLLAAPTGLQLLHLAVADALWLALVWLSACALTAPARAEQVAPVQRAQPVTS